MTIGDALVNSTFWTFLILGAAFVFAFEIMFYRISGRATDSLQKWAKRKVRKLFRQRRW